MTSRPCVASKAERPLPCRSLKASGSPKESIVSAMMRGLRALSHLLGHLIVVEAGVEAIATSRAHAPCARGPVNPGQISMRLAVSFPQRHQAAAECLRLFGEQAAGDPGGGGGVHRLAGGDQGRQARAPGGERLM